MAQALLYKGGGHPGQYITPRNMENDSEMSEENWFVREGGRRYFLIQPQISADPC